MNGGLSAEAELQDKLRAVHSVDSVPLCFATASRLLACTQQASTPGVSPPSVVPVPLSPHLKTLLELKARDAVTSLSLVYVPETATDSVAAGAADAEAATTAAAAAQASESAGDRGGHGSPIHREVSNPEATETDKVDAASAAGVYVAAGLETGVVEVLRLSSRREGTRTFDLVRASERSDRMFSPLDAAAASPRPVDERPDTGQASGDGLVGGGDRDANNERPRGGYPERSASGASERNVSPQAAGTVGDSPARLRLDREGSRLAEQSAGLPEATTAATAAPTASAFCGWHVPAEDKASESWTGRGLVVGFSDTGLGTAPFAGTPRTPLDRTYGKAPRLGWGKAGESGGGRSGRRTTGADEHQVFAACTMDGCVRCCQVTSNVEGQPRWKRLWTRQTKASFFFAADEFKSGGWLLRLRQGGDVFVFPLMFLLHTQVGVSKLSCVSSSKPCQGNCANEMVRFVCTRFRRRLRFLACVREALDVAVPGFAALNRALPCQLVRAPPLSE